MEIKKGRPKTYQHGYKVITRSIPVDLIPALDKWLSDNKAKQVIRDKVAKDSAKDKATTSPLPPPHH